MPTLKELLEKGESFKYGTDYNKVEADKQRVSDFEQDGLRPNRINLGTDLYGTDTLRITRQSTSILDDMRANANANQGLIGGLIGNISKKVNNFASKLGIPVLQIPTRVSDSLIAENFNTLEMPETLAKIKKSGEGNILGKFLKQTAKGTPNQLGRRAIGGGIGLAKEAAKNALFGNGEVDLSPSANDTINNKPFGDDERWSNLKIYSKNIKPSKDQEKGLKIILNGMVEGESDYNPFLFDKFTYNTNNYANPESEQFPKFPEFSLESLTQNIPGKIDKTYTNDSSASLFRMDKSEIGKFNTKSDKVNLYGVWEGDADGNPTEQIVDNKTIDDLDFLPFRFFSVAKGKGVSFKATVNGISENFSPSWEGSNFIGNPYTIYNYQSIDRDLTFSFSIYSLSGAEHKKNWEKLDFLTSLVYPQNETNNVYVTPPLLKFTLGNMYKNKLGFIESLSYTIDDNTPWEIGYQLNDQGNLVDNGDLKDYKLPTIINVSVSYQIIETQNDVVGKKLYPYGTGGSVEVGQGEFGAPQT